MSLFYDYSSYWVVLRMTMNNYLFLTPDSESWCSRSKKRSTFPLSFVVMDGKYRPSQIPEIRRVNPHFAGNFTLITNQVRSTSENEPFGQYSKYLHISLFTLIKTCSFIRFYRHQIVAKIWYLTKFYVEMRLFFRTFQAE